MEELQHKRPAMTCAAAVHLAAPHTWPAAVLPVLLGTVTACAAQITLQPWLLLLVLCVAVALQSAVNTLNDYRDFISGLDTAENCTDTGDAALLYDGCTAKGALCLGLCFLLCAAIGGAALVILCGKELLLYGGLALLAILLYILPRISFSGLPLGEVLSGIAMGGVLTCAAFRVQSGFFTSRLLVLCLPAVLTIGCILLVNNTCDIEKDKVGKRKTLAVCIGRAAADWLLRLSLLLAALGVLLILMLCFPRGIAAAAVLPVVLCLGNSTRCLFLQSMTPDRRRDCMGAVLSLHKWILGCYVAGIVLSCLK